jgi:hypothetical protein
MPPCNGGDRVLWLASKDGRLRQGAKCDVLRIGSYGPPALAEGRARSLVRLLRSSNPLGQTAAGSYGRSPVGPARPPYLWPAGPDKGPSPALGVGPEAKILQFCG